MSGQTILVVDDDDAIRLSLREFLSDRGLRVLVASDGVGAIQHLIDNDVSIIISDYRMKHLGGDSWIRFLTKFCPDIPVYIISGFLPDDVDVPYPILSKPFDYGELARRVVEDLGTGDT